MTITTTGNGYLLRDLAKAALAAIVVNQNQLNALNVFPVPDGDTGTNMALTMRGIASDMDTTATEHVPTTVNAMARAALLGARGNSGLIMAQLFRGLRDAMTDAAEVNAKNFAHGLSLAAQMAYGAVPNPVEGTMLTVIREAAETAEKAVENGADINEVVEAAATQALDTTERTPEMLAVLEEAGVVDAGGFGLALMLMGMSQYLRSEGDGSVHVDAPGIENLIGESGVIIDTSSLEIAEEEAWGYCTNIAIEGTAINIPYLSEQFNKIGRSTVIAGDETIAKIHVHMEDPGEAVSLAVQNGALTLNVSIQNMDAQTAEWAENRRADAASAEQPTDPVDIAVVAVAAGDGMANYFRQAGMGATFIVEGGDTLNPSVADLLEAVDAAPSDRIILLPNNKNIIGAARQASELTEKSATVIETRSMQEGIAAISAFDLDADLDENAEEMTDMLEELHVGSVFRASRDATMGGVQVSQGQFMVIVDGETVAASDDELEMLIAGVESIMHHGALVAVYVGEEIAPDVARAAETRLTQELAHYHRSDIQFIRGNQPHYAYLFAVE
jgi:DAK2 domain fusion protein YloV